MNGAKICQQSRNNQMMSYFGDIETATTQITSYLGL